MTRLHLVVPAVLLALAPPVSAQNWSGTVGDGNWNNANNWLPQTFPNSQYNVVNFDNANPGTVNISSSVQAYSLNFAVDGDTGFNLTSSPGQTLSSLTAINLPNPTGSEYATNTINLAYQAGGNLLFANGSSLTITNNTGNVGAPGLVIGPNTVIGTPGVGGVVVTGYGSTTISGSFASGNTAVVGGLTKTGVGSLDFSGDGTQLQGGVTLSGGTLDLDYTTNAASKLGSGNLSLYGGYLTMMVNAAAVTQSVNGTTNLAGGHTEISATGPASNNVITLNLGAIARSPGATVDFTSSGPTFVGQTSTGNTNGLLGTGPAYATTGYGSTWAWNAGGGYINGLTASGYSVDNYAPGANTDVTNSFTNLFTSATTNSLRFNGNSGSSSYLFVNGGTTLTLQSGGILMTANSGPTTIYNGPIAAGNGTGELLVHQWNTTNALTIDSAIVAGGGLTLTGGGTLVLGGNNTGLTGPINVNYGSLTVTQTAAVNSATTINLNDNAFIENQFLTLQLGNGVNGTISPNIRLGSSYYANIFNTGTSVNSSVTLSGTISSSPGAGAPLTVGYQQDISSGINLTGNNTFLGDVYLYGGSLGVNSNASLGNTANSLYFFGTTAGGLVFLNGGVNLARSVYLLATFPTRIVSNASNVNTISGVISDYYPIYYGGATLYKAGTGTLILTNVNTYSGGTEIDAGTLSVGADYNLGAALAPVAINGGGTLAVSSGFATARPLLLGSTSAVSASGSSNIAVPAGQTFTPTGGISDNVGAGTLGITGPGTVVLNTPNTYSGGTSVQQGTLLVGMDSALGAASGPVAIGPLGTLTYTASASTSRTFTMNSGTLSVAAGQTLTLQNATVGGGFLVGKFATVAGASTAFVGGTSTGSTSLTLNGSDVLVNFNQGGQLNIAAGQNVTLTRVTNQGSGSITVGAGSAVNVADFQTYGMLTLTPNTSAAPTILTNTGASPLSFNGGSQTFIGTPATADPTGQNIVDYVDLHGNNAIVAGGLFVNNGGVYDTVGAGTGTIIAEFGALVKGAGFYQNTVKTQNGGKFQTGNSPGSATFGNFVFGPGGVNNYVFAIDDATGVAGPSPNASGLVSGWGLIKAVQVALGTSATSGNFMWTATPSNPLTVAIDTLVNPTMVGTDVAGPMADFDPNQSYSWTAARWTGAYSGPTDASTLDADTSFDTSGIVNPIAGTFGWSLDPVDQALSLVYTPSSVPEPGTLVLVGLAAAGAYIHRRRARRVR